MLKRALISVSNKSGVAEFAKRLSGLGWEIISTGGTAKVIADTGIPVTTIEDITGFPECFGGRVKTMHPKIMGGILMRRDNANDKKEAKKNGIEPIAMVVVNLYPFEEGVGVGIDDEMIELIDIGGPTLLRSAAKNFTYVTAVCDPADYDRVIIEITQSGDTALQLRKELAAKVFLRTAAYDAAITAWLSEGKNTGVMLTQGTALRYGENPHQWGKFYEKYASGMKSGEIGKWKVLQQEKPLSYLNILDADAAWNLVCEFSEPTAACIKHANPSGVASHDDIDEAFQRSYDTDKLSAFGVIVALNRPCTETIIQKIIEQKIFTEVIIAPSFDDAARKLLKQKPKIRALESLATSSQQPAASSYRTALGGMLVQNNDDKVLTKNDVRCVTTELPTDRQVDDLLFAWKVAKHCKSNAIVFAKDKITVGIGCGQTSRIDAVWIAAKRAGSRAEGAVMASDAFFPFSDSVEESAKYGITAIIQPGGSIRDEEVIAKANDLKIPMILTGVRGFRH